MPKIYVNNNIEVFRRQNENKEFEYTVKENGKFLKNEDNTRKKFDFMGIKVKFDLGVKNA